MNESQTRLEKLSNSVMKKTALNETYSASGTEDSESGIESLIIETCRHIYYEGFNSYQSSGKKQLNQELETIIHVLQLSVF